MAIRLGTVTGRRTDKNRDGGGDRLLLQVEMSNADDVQTVEMINAPGEDSNPPNGSQVLIVDLGPAFKAAIAADDGVDPSMSEAKRSYTLLAPGRLRRL